MSTVVFYWSLVSVLQSWKAKMVKTKLIFSLKPHWPTLFLVVMFNHPSCLLNTNQLGYCLEFSFPHYRQAVSKAYCILLIFASFFPLLTSCRTIDFSFESLEAYLILGIFIVISSSLQAMMLMALFVACHFDCGGLLFVCWFFFKL